MNHHHVPFPLKAVAVLLAVVMTLGLSGVALNGIVPAAQADGITITRQPTDTVVRTGQRAYFSVEAQSDGELSYQWQYSSTGTRWNNSSSASAATKDLSIAGTAANTKLWYRCAVTSGNETVYSDLVKMSINDESPRIVQQPENTAVQYGARAYFHIVAEGENLTYQWQYSSTGTKWGNSSGAGAKTPDLNVAGNDSNAKLWYRCAVTSEGVTIYSDSVKMRILEGPRILQQPVDTVVQTGTRAYFSVVAEGRELTYQWQYSSTGTKWANSSAAAAKTANLSIAGTASNAKLWYRCEITGLDENDDPAVVYTNLVKMSIDDSMPVIVTQPVDTAVKPGNRAYFSVKATGTNLTYQWQYSSTNGEKWGNSTAAAAKTPDLSIAGVAANTKYIYRCAVSCGAATVYTNTVRMTLLSPPVIDQQPTNAVVQPGQRAYFHVVAHGDNLTYQWQYSTTGEKWYNSSAAAAKTPDLSIAGSASNTKYFYRCVITDENGLTVYTDLVKMSIDDSRPEIVSQPVDAVTPGGQRAYFHIVAQGEDLTYQWQYSTTGEKWYNSTAAAANTPDLSIAGVAANTKYMYRCAVTGSGVTVYSDTVRMILNGEMPRITEQPVNTTVRTGERAYFHVVAEGENLTYQWQYSSTGEKWGNSSAAAAKTPDLSIAGSAANTNYFYRCAVTGSGYTVYTDLVKMSIDDTVTELTAEDVTATGTCFRYNGEAQSPAIAVTSQGAALTEGKDYTLAYSGDHTENGTYTVTVTGINAYAGTFEFSFTISESGHTPTAVPGAPASCTEPGLTEGSVCAVCGTVLAEQEPIAPLGHQLTLTEAAAATCENAGNNAYYTCSECGGVFADPDGETATTPEEQAIPQLPHSWRGAIRSNEDGTHSYQCVNGCGQYSEPVPCVFGAWTEGSEATCTEDGEREHTCGACGYTVNEKATGHNYVWVHTPASCSERAFQQKKCDVCDMVFGEAIYDETTEPLGHKPAVKHEATCTEGEYYETNCDRSFEVIVYDEANETELYRDILVCGYLEKEYNDEKPALGHDIDETQWQPDPDDPPTCLLAGLEYNTCSRCGKVTRQADPLGHDVSGQIAQVVTEASCDQWGLKTKQCVRCGQAVEIPVPPKHSFKKKASQDPLSSTFSAKCTTDGYTIRSCDNGCTVALDALQPGSLIALTQDSVEIDDVTIAVTSQMKRIYASVVSIQGTGDALTATVNFAPSGHPELSGTYGADEFTAPVTKSTVALAKGHEAPLIEYKPRTCEEDGYYIYEGTCTRSGCGAVLAREVIVFEKTGHVPVSDDAEATCTEGVLCKNTAGGEHYAIPPLGHDFSVPGCVLTEDDVNGFYCRRCGTLPETTSEKINRVKEVLNLIKSPEYAAANRVSTFNKSKMETTYTKFDFGIWTTVVKNEYERMVSGTTINYEKMRTASVFQLFPFSYRNFSIKNTFSADDIDSIQIEQLPAGLNTNSLLATYAETSDDGDPAPDIARFTNKVINEPVIRVTIDLKNEMYYKGSPEFPQNADTHVSKVFNYDIREIVTTAGYDENWSISEGSSEDGYSMSMQLNSISDDAKAYYYLTADDYEPIAVIYKINEKMVQELEMEILTVNGTIKPVITTAKDYVYLFENYFES